MDTTNLIIEDFDFSRYPIVRTYPLGDKTVIQIGESLGNSSKSSLGDKIRDLEGDISGLEKEVKELEEANDETESKFEKLDIQMVDINVTQRTDECLGDHPHGNSIEYLSKELERKLCSAQLEISNLKEAISLFCKGQQWADPSWKEQSHIAPLFKIAEKL